MNESKPKYDVIERFKTFRNSYDKILILFSGFFWICSSLWDVYKFQRYWLDYAMEFYSSFFFFNMMIFSINPELLPLEIYNLFSFITTFKGRGTLLLIISSLFLSYKNDLHKICAYIMFIGGIIYFICEILVPTTKEELEKIESIFNNKKNKIKNLGKKRNNNINYDANKSISIFDKTNSNLNNFDNTINLNQNDSIHIESNSQTNLHENLKNNKGDENVSNKNIVTEEHEDKKADNPYNIPDDF